MSPRFGTDGIRGTAGVDLTPEVALGLGRVAARLVRGGPFLLGRDTRRSGPMLQAALAAGLAAEGATVVDVGVLPTPGLAWLARERHGPAAMVSASHNPFGDNGIKLLAAGGAKLPSRLEIEIESELDQLLANRTTSTAPAGAGIGEVGSDPAALSAYVDHLVHFAAGLDLDRGPLVVDCANGAASAVAPAVLRRLGVAHEVVHGTPNGLNINAGCGSTDLASLQRAVVGSGAALGVALDGDGDRMLAVDHTGKVVDGDQLLALFAVDMAARGLLRGDRIVATVLSNLGLRRALEAAGIGLIETAVGDRHVTDALDSEGLVLGGEQSGHLVFKELAPSGDGMLTALLLLDLLARAKRPLAELADSAMQRAPQQLTNVAVPDPSRLAAARDVWKQVSRVEAELGTSGRVLLRASGTEQLVRVMVEAPTTDLARDLSERLVAVVVAELGSTNGVARP